MVVGSLDRGLEEGGAVEFQTAVDFSSQAIHTQRANATNPETMRLYCGSVDDFFDSALAGSDPKLIANVGEVELVAAGSPCPGTYKRVVMFMAVYLLSCRIFCAPTKLSQSAIASECVTYQYLLQLRGSLPTPVRYS